MTAIDMPRRDPIVRRILFAVPILGRMAREIAEGDDENILYAVLAFVSLWGCAILIFGLPGLYIPALALVPVIWIVLIAMAGI